MSVLVIDRAPPISDSQGNELIARQVFRRLRRDHRLILVAPVTAGEEDAARDAIAGLFDEVHLVPRPTRMASLRGWLEGTVAHTGLPLAGRVDGGAASDLAAEIRRVVATGSIDVAHVRQLPMSAYRSDLGSTPGLLELVDWRRWPRPGPEAAGCARSPGARSPG